MGEKLKVCISIDEETFVRVQAAIRDRRFRNRSHAFEYAIAKVLEAKE